MLAYSLRRLLSAIPVLLIGTFIIFAIVSTIRDPVAELRQSCPTCDEGAYARLIDLYDLDQPIPQRYVSWLGDTLQGDLGTSTLQGERPVSEIFWERARNTMMLAIPALLLTEFIAVSIAVYSAVRQYSLGDYLTTGFSYLGLAMPTFFFGLLLQVFWGIWFQDWTGLKPFWTSGLHDENFRELLSSITLPVLTLSMVTIAADARFGRAAMLEIRNSDFIRTARAKGVPERTVVLKHMLRNALIPIVTVMALTFSGLLGGAVITESIFSWPGLGRMLLGSIFAGDTDAVMAVMVFLAVLAIGFNLLADLIYGWLDPRIRYD